MKDTDTVYAILIFCCLALVFTIVVMMAILARRAFISHRGSSVRKAMKMNMPRATVNRPTVIWAGHIGSDVNQTNLVLLLRNRQRVMIQMDRRLRTVSVWNLDTSELYYKEIMENQADNPSQRIVDALRNWIDLPADYYLELI